MPSSAPNKKELEVYNNILNDLPLIIYHCLPGNKITFANKSFHKFFNTTNEIVVGKIFSPQIHPDDSDIFITVMNSLIPGESISKLTCRIIVDENNIKWTEWNINSLNDDRGIFTEFQVIINDISDRRKAELTLKRSEEQYRLAFDKAADMIVILDKTGNFIDLNEKFEIESGWKKEEMIGKSVFNSNIITNDSSRKISHYLNKFLAGEEVPSIEIQGITKDDTIIDYELHAVPITKDGNIIAFHAILRNISYRKSVEKALSESQRQLTNLMSSLPGMAYRCSYDKTWTMKFVSDGSLNLTGYAPDSLIDNKNCAYGDLIVKEDRDFVYDQVTKAVENSESFQMNYRIRTSDGSLKWVWEQGSGVKNSKGEIEAVEGFITDITEQKITQEALSQNEELYRKLIATLPDMIIITDMEGKIIFVNEQGIKICGFNSIAELKNLNIIEIIADKYRERILSHFSKMIDQKSGPVEISFINTNNQKIDFEVNGEVLRNLDNAPYGFIFSCREISTRKIAEAALAHSELQYRTLVDSMQDGVFLIQDGRLNFVNEAFANIIGYSTDELRNLEFTKIVSPEDYDLVLNNYKKRQAGESVPASYEWRMLHRDGSRVYVNMSVRLIKYKDKVASIGTIKDITNKKRMEDALLNQQKILYGVAEASNVLLVEKDFNAAISKTLLALGESTGVSRVYIFENRKDYKSNKIFMCHKYEWVSEGTKPQIDDPELQMLFYDPYFSDWFQNFLNGNYICSLVKDLHQHQRLILEKENILSILEVPINIKDKLWGFIGFDDCVNERIWSESEISVLKAAAASIGGAIEREKTNNELIGAKEKAEDLSKIKSNFLANMSHELRTPLIGILGYAELMSQETDNENWKVMLNTIYSGGERLLETLNHLLDLSKIEADKVQINYEPINLKELINEVITLFVSVVTKKKIYLKSVVESGDINFESDKRILRSILSNLVSNAIKFTEKGGVLIETELKKSTDHSSIIFRITDTGIGIPEYSKKIIYDEFRQASEGLSRHFEGTGLGLTITKRFIELLGGNIDFVSNFGEGTTFFVSIPVTETYKKRKYPEISSGELKINEKKQMSKVILVDDDPASRSVISLFLRKDYEVDTAATGEEAISIMQHNDYDLILLDISLGKGINGLDLIKLLRKKQKYSSTPIIAVTAHAMVGDRERFLSEGFDDYIAKPFTKLELSNKLNMIMNK